MTNDKAVAMLREAAQALVDAHPIRDHHVEALRTALAATAHIADGVEAERAATQPAVEVDQIRALGWMVAVHNDYRLNGEAHTFWLFTKDGQAIKGEGRTDAEALAQVQSQIAAPISEASAAPYIKDADQQGGLCASVLNALYKACHRGDSVERIHAAVMALINAQQEAKAEQAAPISNEDILQMFATCIGNERDDARQCYVSADEVIDFVRCWIMPALAKAASSNEGNNNAHDWAGDGERCAKCGDKDWFADPLCSGKAKPTSPDASGFLPLPQHTRTGNLGAALYSANQMHAYVLADRAARAVPAKSIGDDDEFVRLLREWVASDGSGPTIKALIAHIDAIIINGGKP